MISNYKIDSVIYNTFSCLTTTNFHDEFFFFLWGGEFWQFDLCSYLHTNVWLYWCIIIIYNCVFVCGWIIVVAHLPRFSSSLVLSWSRNCTCTFCPSSACTTAYGECLFFAIFVLFIQFVIFNVDMCMYICKCFFHQNILIKIIII